MNFSFELHKVSSNTPMNFSFGHHNKVSNGSSGFEGLIIAFIGGAFFLHGFARLRLKRRAQGLATSKIRSMAMGTVEISGTAACDVKIMDPIYHQPCAYFHVRVEERRGSGKNTRWVTVFENQSNGMPFYCRDLTGQVLVVPDSPELYLANKLTRNSSFFGGLSGTDDAPTKFMKGKGSGYLQLTAEIIREGDPLYLIGVAQPLIHQMRRGGGVSIREAAENLKKDPTGMKQMDINQDGQIDALEWEMGVAKRKKEIDSQNETEALDNREKTNLFTSTAYVSKGPGSKLVLASDEKQFVSSLGRSAVFEIIAGGIALVYGLVHVFIYMQ